MSDRSNGVRVIVEIGDGKTVVMPLSKQDLMRLAEEKAAKRYACPKPKAISVSI
jgi:hypothetical protein